jgi:antitoxin component of MazEF toxin-antitoxin module
MAEVFLDSKQWGNTLAVRLPAAVARAAHLQADQRVTTAECNADNPFAVAIGLVKGRSKAGKTSYVLCHQPT